MAVFPNLIVATLLNIEKYWKSDKQVERDLFRCECADEQTTEQRITNKK